MALALAAHDGSEQSGATFDAETAQYIAITEQNEATARWLFSKEGLERDLDVRRLAARTLKRCSSEAVTKALIETLNAEDLTLQIEAASALAEIATEPASHQALKECAERLRLLCKNEDRNLRLMALRALARANIDAPELFLTMLNDNEPMVRMAALQAIGANTNERSTAETANFVQNSMSAVLRCLKDHSASVRLAAAKAATGLVANHNSTAVNTAQLADAIFTAALTGGGDQCRAFARTARNWNPGAAAAACLARIVKLDNSIARRFAIEFIEEIYLDA